MPASFALNALSQTTPPNAPVPETSAFDPLLAALLCCPACAARPALVLHAGAENALVCASCGRVYPVKNGVPYLFMDDNDSDPGNEESRARF